MRILEKMRSNTKLTAVINFFLNALIVIFSFFLVCMVAINFQTMFLGKAYNNFFGYSFFEVETGSMAGTIEIGDWIVVKLDTDYKLNDIVTYQENDSFITHRIIEVYGDNFVTKGDANNSNDSTIKKDAVIGKVVKIIPRLGFIEKIILNPKFIIFFIVLLSLFCHIISDKDDKISEAISKRKAKNKKKVAEPLQKEVVVDEDSLEFAKNVFQKMKDEDVASSKTVILSSVKVDLDTPALKEYKNND